MLTNTEEPRTKILKNGAVYDMDEKRIVANPGGGTGAITQTNASAMAKKRWEAYRRKAVERIVGEAKSVDLTVSSGADAFGLVAAKQYQALMDSDKPRIADLEKLGQIMTGQTASSQRENTSAPSENAITAPPAAILALVDMIERQRSAAVERARAVDVEATDTRSA